MAEAKNTLFSGLMRSVLPSCIMYTRDCLAAPWESIGSEKEKARPSRR
ncbi:MAG: hypothetical protein OJF48_000577 [Afipia sp.]|nr:MAG: hypothetical protein OJF48_000577 [Afipia sp.]